MNSKYEALRPDAERLTVESAKGHFERLEIRQSTPLERDSVNEFVAIAGEHFE